MPHELDRIKELAGLQQEAAVSLKGKESALKAWYNKYSKYTGGNGDPLPFGLIKAYTESGIISDGYEENELAKAEKALGKKEGDWEDQDWQKVYSMTPITQGMEQDLLKITGSKTIDEELLAKVYDVIEDMYPSYDQVLGKKESAVQEAPASGDQAKVQALLTWFTNKYNEYKQALINQEKENGNKNIQAYLDNNDELGELEEIISSLKTGNMQQAIDSINDAKFEFSGIPGDGDDFFQLLNKLGIPKKTFWFGESAVQEAPAGGDQALAKEIAKLYKEMVEVINDNSDNPDDIESDYNWGYGPDDDEEARALMKAFNTSLEAGLQLVKKIKIERGKSLLGDESDWDPFHPQSERHDELKAMFAKYGKKFTEESAVQPTPVLNAVKETPAISQVDEAIKKATAQLKSFSNFDGLKPYKPKKK